MSRFFWAEIIGKKAEKPGKRAGRFIMTQKWKHEMASFFLESHVYFEMGKSTENGQKSNQNLPWKEICNQWISRIYIYIWRYILYIYIYVHICSISELGPNMGDLYAICFVMFCPFEEFGKFVQRKKNLWDPWWKFVTCRASVGHYTWKHHGTQRVRCPRSYGGFILRILIGCSMKKNILRIFGVPFMESSISWGIPWLKSPNCTWLDRFASFEWWKRAVLAAPEPSNLFYGLKDRKGLCGWIVLSTSQMISNYRKLHYCWKWSVNSVLILRYPENCLLQLVHGRSCHATVLESMVSSFPCMVILRFMMVLWFSMLMQSESVGSTEASHVWRSHPFNGGWLVRFVMSMSGWASKVVKFHLPQKPLPSGND